MVEGGLVYLDKPDNGSMAAYEDGFTMLELCRNYYRSAGLNVSELDRRVRSAREGLVDALEAAPDELAALGVGEQVELVALDAVHDELTHRGDVDQASRQLRLVDLRKLCCSGPP